MSAPVRQCPKCGRYYDDPSTAGDAMTERVIRPGCRSLKVDQSKVGKEPKLPWKKAGHADRKQQLQTMRTIGNVSMLQIGPDEYRTLNRKERRARGMRGRGKV